jgi:hypothetical protein
MVTTQSALELDERRRRGMFFKRLLFEYLEISDVEQAARELRHVNNG